MWSRLSAALCIAGFFSISLSSPLGEPHSIFPQQEVLAVSSKSPPEAARKLKGRFLHITDIHPDPFYENDSDPDRKCHHGHSNDAGKWGAPTTSCDSPWSLVNETFRWVHENLRDEIDFVVWTGDSARHDNDVEIPRTATQIYGLNQQVADQMFKTFEKPDNSDDDDPTNDMIVPVVPNLGNNDVYPHNIMTAGPNRITKEYLNIWKRFMPEDQYHVFRRGGYFWNQVVPGKNGKTGAASDGGLAVISLNTLYFYDSNRAADGCDCETEPGYEQMEWLSAQLAVMRERNMKAILIGHVPPTWTSEKQSWDETCWKKYTLWSKQYRDVIVGHIYGHMNLDHFIVLDTEDVEPAHENNKKHKKHKKHNKQKKHGQCGKTLDSVINTVSDFLEPLYQLLPFTSIEDESDTDPRVPEFDPEADPTLSASSAKTYLESLRDTFSYIPTKGLLSSNEERFDSYKDKIGGKWAERYVVTHVGPSVVPNYLPTLRVYEYNTTGLTGKNSIIQTEGSGAEFGPQKEGERSNRKDENIMKKKQKIPEGPSKNAPPGPAYSMQPFTWLGYTQYYANITKLNTNAKEQNHLSPTATSGEHPELRRDVQGSNKNKLEYELGYDTRKDKIYRLKDLTVKNYLKHARRIVDATLGDASLDADEAVVVDEADTESDSDSDSETEDDSEIDIDKKKKKHKKHKKHKKDLVWHSFVKRAMVGTISDAELDSL